MRHPLDRVLQHPDQDVLYVQDVVPGDLIGYFPEGQLLVIAVDRISTGAVGITWLHPGRGLLTYYYTAVTCWNVDVVTLAR